MRRSCTTSDELDRKLIERATRENKAVTDVMVDAIANYLGYRLTKHDTQNRKPHYASAQVAKSVNLERTAKRATNRRAIISALADPEKARILNQIMGLA